MLHLKTPSLGQSSLEDADLSLGSAAETPVSVVIPAQAMRLHPARSTHFVRWAKMAFPDYTFERQPGGLEFLSKDGVERIDCLWGEICICVDGVPFVQSKE